MTHTATFLLLSLAATLLFGAVAASSSSPSSTLASSVVPHEVEQLYSTHTPIPTTEASPYNATLSLLSLRYSGAAYCPLQSVLAWSCSFCNEITATTNFSIYGVSYNASTDMLAYVGYESESDTIVVAFRGTNLLSILDWLADLKFGQTSIEYNTNVCDGCKVHEGFLSSYLSIRNQIVQLVHEITAIYPDSNLMITGHSLGGALAYLSSLDFALNENITATHMYTFGQPRVGNEAMTKVWESIFDTNAAPSTVYRVTHGLDPVPHLPPRLFSYIHNPTEVYYDGLNLGYHVCDGSGEDPKCADQWLAPIGVTDHVTYLGIDFVAEFLKCNL